MSAIACMRKAPTSAQPRERHRHLPDPRSRARPRRRRGRLKRLAGRRCGSDCSPRKPRRHLRHSPCRRGCDRVYQLENGRSRSARSGFHAVEFPITGWCASGLWCAMHDRGRVLDLIGRRRRRGDPTERRRPGSCAHVQATESICIREGRHSGGVVNLGRRVRRDGRTFRAAVLHSPPVIRKSSLHGSPAGRQAACGGSPGAPERVTIGRRGRHDAPRSCSRKIARVWPAHCWPLPIDLTGTKICCFLFFS